MFKHRQKQFMVLYLTGLLSKVIACSIAMWSLDLIFDLENKEELGVVNKEEIACYENEGNLSCKCTQYYGL